MKEVITEFRLLVFIKILQVSIKILPKNHPETNIIMKAYHDMLTELFNHLED